MKFVFLTFTLIHCITAVANECVQTFESSSLSNSDRKNIIKQHIAQRKIEQHGPIATEVKRELDQHIEWLKSMGVSEERAVFLAGDTHLNPFHSFQFPTSSKGQEKLQQLKQSMEHLLTTSGLSKEVVFQLFEKYYSRNKNFVAQTEENLKSLAERLDLSEEEIKAIRKMTFQYALREQWRGPYPTLFAFPYDRDSGVGSVFFNVIVNLSKAGFTNQQIIQMSELGIVAYNTASNPFKRRKSLSVEEKHEILRKAGFTQAEINHIPKAVMQQSILEMIRVNSGAILPPVAVLLLLYEVWNMSLSKGSNSLFLADLFQLLGLQ